MTVPVVVEGLTMAYGDVDVLAGVDFDVRVGEVFALLGSNGAGKTTTVEILEGHRHRTGGRVRVLGIDPAAADRRFRDRIGVVLQSTSLDPDLRVIEAARLQASYHSRPLHPADALDLMGLAGQRRRRVGVLSGGQRRRLDLALAVIGRPELVFLDEPTTGLDPEARRSAWALVDKLRDEGATVLLTSHHLDEVQRLADRVGVLHGGRLVALGTVDELGGGAHEISFVTDTAGSAGLGERFDLVDRGGRLVLRTTDPTGDVNRLTSVAIEHGWPIDGLEVGLPDLEHVFFDLIGAGG